MAAEVIFFFFYLNEIKYWHLNVLSAIRFAAGCYPFFIQRLTNVLEPRALYCAGQNFDLNQ